MGLNQHLQRSIYAIMQQGGIKVSDEEIIMPKPLLLGRNKAKLEAISRDYGRFKVVYGSRFGAFRPRILDLLRRANHRPARRRGQKPSRPGKTSIARSQSPTPWMWLMNSTK